MPVPTRSRLLENGDLRLMESGTNRLLNLSYDPYLGYPIFPFRANWVEDPSDAMLQSMTTLDNQTGLHLTRAHTTAPISQLQMLVTLAGRTEINTFRSYVRDMKGRQQPMWVPTWMADLKLVDEITSSYLDVESVGYTANLYPHAHRKHLAIIDHAGLIMARKVTAASDNGTKEDLTINSPVDDTVYQNASLVSFLLFCRLSSDSIQIRWNSHEFAEAKVSFTELPPEAPTS